MAVVTFISPSMVRPVVIQLPERERVSLLALALAYKVPLGCDCQDGICGECAVKVAPKRQEARRTRLSPKEKYILLAAGKIKDAEYQARDLPDHPPLWRLACEYEVGGDEEIIVAFGTKAKTPGKE